MKRAFCGVLVATFGCVLILSGGVATASPIAWEQVADLPGAQHSSGVAIMDGILYVAGGQQTGSPPPLNILRRYDIATDTWLSNGPSMSTSRYTPGAGVINGPGGKELYMVGGYSGYAGLNVVERYSVSTGSWQTMAPITGGRGHGIMTAVVNNQLYALGGFSNNNVHFSTNRGTTTRAIPG